MAYAAVMLAFDPTPLAPSIEELDRLRRDLDYRGPLPRAWMGRLRRELEVEAVAASTSMEGVRVTVDEVRRILVGDRPRDVSPQDADLVRGYRDAMGFVLRRADDPGFRWDRELLVALHDRILAGRFDLGAGRIRAGPTIVVDSGTGTPVFEPPDAGRVTGLLDDMTEQMQRGFAHPALGAAWLHVCTAAIHPFRDGNGRAARVLASLVMYRGGFKLPEFTSLEEWWGRHLGDYYAAFSCLGPTFDPGADVTPFIEAHLRAQLSQIRALALREKVQRQIWLALEELAARSSLPPRTTNAIWDAFFGRDTTPRTYRPLADVSPQSASADLAGCVSAGLLQAVGAGRSRRYVAREDLFEGVAGVLGIDATQAHEAARDIIVAELTRRVAETAQ